MPRQLQPRSTQPRNTHRQTTVTRSKKDDLEHYAQLFFKYSVVIEDHTGIIRRTHSDPQILDAHAKMVEEQDEQQKAARQLEANASIDDIEGNLKYYEELCERPPQTLLELS